MKWYFVVLLNTFDFEGRARRKEFWMFALVNMIVSVALMVAAAVTEESALALAYNVYSILVILPGIAVAIRRMHDTNRRGWWILAPFVGLVFAFFDSQPGENRFGPNPKAVVPA